jgi:transcriptional regulator with XRE-family HTH domain
MTVTPGQIGRTLQRLREARGLSRAALGRTVGISGVYVAKLERGRSDPTVGVLQRLAKALDVPVTRFLK